MPSPPQVHISKLPDYRDNYANSVQVRVSFWDFFLQFGTMSQQTPQEVQLEVFQGIYLSPQQAKALYTVMGENLKQYEHAFGEIKFDAKHAAQPDSIQ